MQLNWNEIRDWLGDLWAQDTLPKQPAPNSLNFSTDSRTIRVGDFFFPLRGENFDGHNFIRQALAGGASGFFCEASKQKDLSGILDATELKKAVWIKNSYESFTRLAAAIRTHKYTFPLFAITGSVGKTTAKHMLATALEELAPTLKTKGSFNNEFGVPMSLLKLEEKHRFAVLEFGARHLGNITSLAKLAQPNIAVCLNVKKIHFSEFKNLETIYQTKSEIFRDSREDAVLITSADDEKLLSLAQQTSKRLVSFGYAPSSTVRIRNVEWISETGGMLIELAIGSKQQQVELSCAHTSYPFHVAGVLAMGHAAGIETEALATALRKFSPETGRFQIHQTQSGLTVIDDSYNASPESMLAGFESCSRLYPQKSKVLILGDMAELGSISTEMHEMVGRKCQELLKPDLLITVGKKAKHLAKAALDAGLAKDKLFSFDEVGQAQRLPQRIYQKRELAYIKGSHAIALDKLVQTLIEPI